MALTSRAVYNGAYGASTDGFGSAYGTGTIQASVPVGATVVIAYLYCSCAGEDSTLAGAIGTQLDGNSISFTALPLDGNLPTLRSGICDVTAIAAAKINGGVGGTYNFSVSLPTAAQDTIPDGGVESGQGTISVDGVVLVVVYTLATLDAIISIDDGFAVRSGNTLVVALGETVDPSVSGFAAEARFGVGYSQTCSQYSTLSVNGTVVNESTLGGASKGGTVVDGHFSDYGFTAYIGHNLISMGAFDDAFTVIPSNGSPACLNERNRYNIAPYVTVPTGSITYVTNQSSQDDNMFLVVTMVTTGLAGVVIPPPPAAGPAGVNTAVFPTSGTATIPGGTGHDTQTPLAGSACIPTNL